MISKYIISILRFYKSYVSPLFGPHCRFTPTCSSYAIAAFEKENPFRAMVKICWRLLRCQPFHPGGYDPI